MAYQQITLADLQVALADRYESVPYWTPEDARLALNEALKVWNAATGFWHAPFLKAVVPNDPYVAVTGSLIQGTRVTYNGIPLEKASLADFNYSIHNWRGTTTASPGAPDRPVYWAPVSLSLLVIYPADTAFGNNLLIDGVRATPLLVNALDFVDLGQEEHDVLLGYALHVLAFKVGGSLLTHSYGGWQAFLRAAGQRNKQFAASAFYRQVMGLDQQRRVFPPDKQVPGIVDALLDRADELVGGGQGQ